MVGFAFDAARALPAMRAAMAEKTPPLAALEAIANALAASRANVSARGGMRPVDHPTR
jgi:hypothetical protein